MLRNTSQHTGQFAVQNPNRSKLSTGRDIRDVNYSIPHHLLGLLLESPSVRANSLMGANLSEHSRLSVLSRCSSPQGTHLPDEGTGVPPQEAHRWGSCPPRPRALLPDHSPSLQLYPLEVMPTAPPVSLLTPLTPGICPFFAHSLFQQQLTLFSLRRDNIQLLPGAHFSVLASPASASTSLSSFLPSSPRGPNPGPPRGASSSGAYICLPCSGEPPSEG